MRPGKAYRLYTEEEAQKLVNTTPPEMIRSNLTYVVLQLKALGIRNILKFQFPSPPPAKNLKSALEILFALGAIDINGDLTQPLGYNMAEFPLDPLYSKLLLNSGKIFNFLVFFYILVIFIYIQGQFGCSEEILTIVSMLQVETVFAKPTTGNGMIKARVQKRLFEVAEGDLIMYLNVYAGFMNSNMERGFCQKNFINYRAMKRVVEIRARLQRMIANYDVPLVSCSGKRYSFLVSGLVFFLYRMFHKF